MHESESPNVTLMALMRTKVGLLYKKYVGGVNVKVSEELLITSALEIKKACPNEQNVIVLDNARIHKRSRTEGIDIPKIIQRLCFFHLFRFPTAHNSTR